MKAALKALQWMTQARLFFKRSSLIMEALARNCWKQMLVGSGRLNSLEKTRNLKWKTGRHKFRKVKKR